MKRLILTLVLLFGVASLPAQEPADSLAAAEQPVQAPDSVGESPVVEAFTPDQLWDRANTAYVNGEQADIVEVDEGLMAVLCPAGTNRVDFVYQADGYSLSRTVTLAAIPVFAVYCGFWWDRKKRKTA